MTLEMTERRDDGLIRRLFEAGAHFGYSKTRNHPSAAPFIFTYKNRSAVIDMEKTLVQLAAAKEFLAGLAAAGKPVLWVGNKGELRGLVERVAERLGLPYVASRWLGGTLTNFPQIKSRIDKLADLKQKRAAGELAVYTKKEQLGFDQQIAKLERYLGSLSGLAALPAAVVVADSAHEQIVVKEARKTGVPIVAIANTDCDLREIDYPIVANDGNIASVKLLLEELADAYEHGARPAAPVAA